MVLGTQAFYLVLTVMLIAGGADISRENRVVAFNGIYRTTLMLVITLCHPHTEWFCDTISQKELLKTEVSCVSTRGALSRLKGENGRLG